jgi:DNA-binding response OmpR family regulator
MTPSRGVGGARVLLVDDEPDQVEMYQYALEIAGFDVSTAYTGAAAIAHAREQRPDVIVLDVRLPDITGWQVCEQLKASPDTDAIPVVILTAVASARVPREVAESGCVAYLLKPCYPDDLARTIRNVVDAAGSVDLGR